MRVSLGKILAGFAVLGPAYFLAEAVRRAGERARAVDGELVAQRLHTSNAWDCDCPACRSWRLNVGSSR